MRSVRKRKRNYKALNGIFTTVKPTSPYPSTYTGFPEDTDDWSCEQWKAYYLNNKKIMGKAEALKIFETDLGSIGSFADGEYCRYDCSFMDFFKKEGLSGGNIFSKLYCASEGVADVAASGVDAVGGIADSISFITNNKLLLTGMVLGGIYLYNKNKNG